jgi:hypothetical protein
MILKDFLGSELNKGDLVVIQSGFIVGQIVEANSGEIARGVPLSGQPQGEVRPPMLAITVQMSSVVVAGPDGKFINLVKVEKPAQATNKI